MCRYAFHKIGQLLLSTILPRSRTWDLDIRRCNSAGKYYILGSCRNLGSSRVHAYARMNELPGAVIDSDAPHFTRLLPTGLGSILFCNLFATFCSRSVLRLGDASIYVSHEYCAIRRQLAICVCSWLFRCVLITIITTLQKTPTYRTLTCVWKPALYLYLHLIEGEKRLIGDIARCCNQIIRSNLKQTVAELASKRLAGQRCIRRKCGLEVGEGFCRRTEVPICLRSPCLTLGNSQGGNISRWPSVGSIGWSLWQ